METESSAPGAAGADDEWRALCISKIQAHVRRFLARRGVLRRLNLQYEKIYDPVRGRFYYYDTANDVSSWTKPLLFQNGDVEKVSPTYFPDEAATIIQRAAYRHIARRLVRLLYADVVKVTVDPAARIPVYTNPKTGAVMNALPGFMGGKLNHGYRDASKIKKKYYTKLKAPTLKSIKSRKSPTSKKDGADSDKDDDEEEEEEQEADEESDGSDLSESSDAVVDRRRQLRNYPR
jgi:hypothetical protein